MREIVFQLHTLYMLAEININIVINATDNKYIIKEMKGYINERLINERIESSLSPLS